MTPKNPYYVLEVPVDATPGDIERQGRKLLGLFEVGAAKARTYTCPFGTFPRDETMVRDAMATLRDPKKRSKESLVAKLFVLPREEPKESIDSPLVDALAIRYRGL